ncbi:MAG: phosphoribosylamine--glycine ligase [Candidatus Muiribacteriota bacterium]
MRVLILGSDARSHCIAWKLYQSEYVKKIYAYPGNAGIFSVSHETTIKSDCFQDIYEFCRKKQINSIFVGPEKFLCDGIYDFFKKRSIEVFGPSYDGAKLEGSKSFAKTFMKKYGIPTADHKEFENKEKLKNYIQNLSFPVVLKYDGLFGGKGVRVCHNKNEVEEHLSKCNEGKFIIEEFLEGDEASLICFMDGKTIKPMIYARDYKKSHDGDKGLNTGGMGAFSNPYISKEDRKKVLEEIVEPTFEGVVTEGIKYSGVIYIGLMFTSKGPKVIEYNVRFGDPETQVLLPLLKTDLGLIMKKIFKQQLDEIKLQWQEKEALCVVLAGSGYPKHYEKGKRININKTIKTLIFMAGVKQANRHFLTDGGRVMSVVAKAKELSEAKRIAYKEINKIYFNNMYYRKDIGA